MSEQNKTDAPVSEKVRLFSIVDYDVEITIKGGQTILVPPKGILKDVPKEWLEDVKLPAGVKMK